MSLDELGDELGISPERVRQIEMSTFVKVQEAVKAHVARRDRRGRRVGICVEPDASETWIGARRGNLPWRHRECRHSRGNPLATAFGHHRSADRGRWRLAVADHAIAGLRLDDRDRLHRLGNG